MADLQPKKYNPVKIRVPQPKRPPDERPIVPESPDTLTAGAPPEKAAGSSKPKARRHPLREYSLRGQADEIEASASEAKPLLGPVVMQGQATMIYAEPNTGKTLIFLKLCLDAIEAGRIDPNDIYYINADDSGEGLSVKLRLMQDAGAHMLAPGFNGLKTDDVIRNLQRAIDEGSARGTCVIIDTLKKFTDLMDKKRTSEFAQVCRQYVMAGGTIVALGHTTKTPNADGTPWYQGTTDILEDFDAVYVAQPLTSTAKASQRVVKLTRKKCRADSPETVAYAYATDAGISYQEKLASVRSVDPDDLDDYTAEIEQVSDPKVMDAIVHLIQAGCADGKMALAKAAAKECSVSHRAAIKILERYTGDTPREHLWNVRTGRHGVQIYELIDQTHSA